jgi:hypothetical protein
MEMSLKERKLNGGKREGERERGESRKRAREREKGGREIKRKKNQIFSKKRM